MRGDPLRRGTARDLWAVCAVAGGMADYLSGTLGIQKGDRVRCHAQLPEYLKSCTSVLWMGAVVRAITTSCTHAKRLDPSDDAKASVVRNPNRHGISQAGTELGRYLS